MNSAGDAEGYVGGVIDMVALWRKFHRRVYHWLYGMVGNAEDAKDLTIRVFEWVWEHREEYDPSRSSVCTWLYLTTHAMAVGFWRKRRLRYRSLETLPVAKEPVDDGPESDHDEAATRERLWRAVDSLPEPEREVTRLRFDDGLSVAETAGRLHVCKRTVKYREARARVLLRVKLRPE